MVVMNFAAPSGFQERDGLSAASTALGPFLGGAAFGMHAVTSPTEEDPVRLKIHDSQAF